MGTTTKLCDRWLQVSHKDIQIIKTDTVDLQHFVLSHYNNQSLLPSFSKMHISSLTFCFDIGL